MSHALAEMVPPSHVQMLARPPGGQLLGREREREVLRRLLDAARIGDGGALVLQGDPGVGKTALLEWTVEQGEQFRVLRTVGVEGEMELPCAALQQLCSPILDRAEGLPDPQRDALGVAFGQSAGQPPNPFLVGLAALGLLTDAAEARPLLCVVDDAQWLDGASARALAFVARRLAARRIAFVLAAREPVDTLAGLPELRVEPLQRGDARRLLESVMPAPLDERVLDRIVVETRGNPLALLELPRGLTPAELAGGFGLPVAGPLSASIEESFTRRLAMLPADARRLLLLAAADPVGDTALVWRAVRRSASPSPRWKPSKPRTCWSSAPGWCSGTRWFARLCIGPPRPMSAARSTEPWRKQPIPRSIPTVAPGTWRRRRRPPMRTSRSNSSVPPDGPRRAAGLPLWLRSSSRRPHSRPNPGAARSACSRPPPRTGTRARWRLLSACWMASTGSRSASWGRARRPLARAGGVGAAARRGCRAAVS